MSHKPSIAVTRRELPGSQLDHLVALANVRVWPDETPPTVDELIGLIGDAEVVVCVNGDPIGMPVLAACPSLRLVAIASVGYDTVDIAAASAADVAVTNCPDVLSETVADATFALMIWARRKFGVAERTLRQGLWTDNRLGSFLGLDVNGATLGIVGYGSIGRTVARRAAGFGMRVVVSSDPQRAKAGDPPYVPLDELLATSDIVTLHVPLTADTRGMIGERELRLMRASATLVNTSRGQVIDESALVRALREGWIHSAGLDVQEREPNPDASDRLLSLPNLVVLPHVGSATLAARSAMVDLAVANAAAFIDGRPLLTPVVAPLAATLADSQSLGGALVE